MIATTTQLNSLGAELANDPAVHAMTDVTGFGLLGHALELARGSNLAVTIAWPAVPLLSAAQALVRQGHVTGASHRNWSSYGDAVTLPPELADWQRHLLCDPQTSGGLLVACAPERAPDILKLALDTGHAAARIIGRVEAGSGVGVET